MNPCFIEQGECSEDRLLRVVCVLLERKEQQRVNGGIFSDNGHPIDEEENHVRQNNRTG